jgi:predicted transcriptional regulator
MAPKSPIEKAKEQFVVACRAANLDADRIMDKRFPNNAEAIGKLSVFVTESAKKIKSEYLFSLMKNSNFPFMDVEKM